MKEGKSKKEDINILSVLYAIFICVLPFVYIKVVIDPVLVPRQIALSIFLLINVLLLFYQRQKTGFQVFSGIVIAFMLLPFAYALSAFQSISVVESYYTVSKILLFASFFVFTVYALISRKLNFELVVKCMVFFSAFIIVTSFIEIIKLRGSGISVFKEDNMYRITSTFGHKNLLSSIVFLCVPFLAASILLLSRIWKMTAGVCLIVCTLLIFILQTRAVIAGIGLSFLITSVISLFLIKGKAEVGIIRWIGLGSVLVILGFGFVAVKYQEKFSLLTRTESMKERINIWHNTTGMIKEYPLTGVGAGNWQIFFPKYGLTRFYDINFTISEGLTNFQRPHNDFLWVFAETGIFGFIIYCSIFLFAFYYLIKLLTGETELKQKLLWLIFFFALLGYVFIAMVDFPLERMEHQIILGLMLAYIASQYINKFEGHRSKISFFLVNIFIGICAAYALWVGINRYEGEKHSYKVIVAHSRGLWEQIIKEGNKTTNTFYNMDPFSIPVKWYVGVGQFTLGDLKAAKESFREAYEIHPYQVHVLNNYATCFEKENDHTTALKLFEEMYRISPMFSAGLINMSGAYFNAGRYDDAYKVISTFKWDDSNPRSQEFMTVILAKKLEIMLAGNKYTDVQRKKLTGCLNSDTCILQTMKACLRKKIPFHEYVLMKQD